MCAGDLYEHELYTPDTVQMLQRLFAEVAPIPVLISPGNHDWYGPGSIYVTADWSPNVHIFDSDDLTPYDGFDGVRVWGFAHRNPSQTVNPLVWMDLAALGLATYALLAAFMVHHFWSDEEPTRTTEMAMFMKNVSIAGAGLVTFALSSTGVDMGWELGSRVFGS